MDGDKPLVVYVTSLPVRGAWVEILHPCRTAQSNQSLPVRGAWVEIKSRSCRRLRLRRRSPCGERGLKFKLVLIFVAKFRSLPVRGAWVEIAVLCAAAWSMVVAPRAGSVG